MNKQEGRRGEKDLEFPPLAKCLIPASTVNSVYIHIIINTLSKNVSFIVLNRNA